MGNGEWGMNVMQRYEIYAEISFCFSNFVLYKIHRVLYLALLGQNSTPSLWRTKKISIPSSFWR
jgi:hypothetical protein